MAGLIHIDGDWHPLVSEGGHATAPVSRPREMAVVAQLAQQFDHVSAERLVSGPGLVHLYGALAAIDGQTVPPLTAEEISAKGQTEDDAYCHEALEMFCGLLGTLAGDLALVLAARGGVYLGGGIVPRLGEFFVRSSFRERFEAKGRMRALLSGIPTFVIEAPRAAMLGDLVALDRSGTASH
jgi:glucokinase